MQDASPREQTTIGAFSLCFDRPTSSLYFNPIAAPVAGIACIPVAEDWWGIFGSSELFKLGWE